MPEAVVGRDAELAALESFLEGLSDRPCALVLEGDPGAGKTTLFEAAGDRARAGGVRVLRAQPAQAEAGLSFSGVADLLGPVLADVVDELPAPQRRALGFALLLEEGEGRPPDQRAVAAAFLGALTALAARGPLLVAIDDVQWLDEASSSALLYAVRRFRDEPVGVLLVVRTGEARAIAREVERSLPQSRFELLEVGALDLSPIHRIVSQRLGLSLPRPLLARIHETSGGNPFYALELARAIAAVQLVEPAAPLPVPETLRELVRHRIDALPEDCRRALLVAAALTSPTPALVTAASRTDGDALRPAVATQIVTMDGDRIRFVHPLLAAAAYEEADPSERRNVHTELADLVGDPEERARHLALAAESPTESVAVALEEAALRARSRGASSSAAELLERAMQLTPPSDSTGRWRRAIEAATYRFESGDGRRARVLLDEVIAAAPPGRVRALALARLARVRSYDDDVRVALALCEQALEEAEGDTLVYVEAHEGAAACLVRLRERLDDLLGHAAAAVEGRRLLEGGNLSEALGVRLLAEGFLGREEAATTLAALLNEPVPDESSRVLLQQPTFNAAVCWYWWDEVERSRTAFETLLVRARELGDESSTPYILTFLGHVEWLTGDYEALARHVQEGLDAAEQAGQSAVRAYLLGVRALALACTGPLEESRRDAEESLELALHTSIRPGEYLARAALGLAALAGEQPEEAAAALVPVVDHARENGLVEPGAIRFVPDAVEALMLVGRLEEAEEILGWYEVNALRLDRASAVATSARARALLAAERGELEEAGTQLERAQAAHDRLPFPFEEARTSSRAGDAAAPPQAAARGARNPRERTRDLREDRRAALGGARRCRAHPHQRTCPGPGGTHARGGARRGTRRRGKDEPGGRRCAVPLRADGRGAPLARLRKARRPTPGGAGPRARRASNTGGQRVKHGGIARFGRAGRSLASSQVVRRPPEQPKEER